MLEKICLPIKKELEELEQEFSSIIETDVKLIQDIFSYVISNKGKRLRPILLLLCSGLKGKSTEISLKTAMIVELLHSATLIHDDVVDNSNLRRGNPSVNSIWENKISVLIGDFLFAHIFGSLVGMKDNRLIKIIAEVTSQMSQGELLQMERVQDFQMDEETYMKLISRKTASLLAATCQIGAITSSVDNETKHIENMRMFGENLGIAFQIKDDLLDFYGSQDDLGKPIGKDLIENIITLPVLYSLKNTDEDTREKMLSILENGKEDEMQTIIEFVKKSGGLNYAEKKANFYIKSALDCLDNYPPSLYKESLILLSEYITARNK
ncbi:polyprenyl synthetase family protein [candidate division KSB1 bacterium]|nr:polyprenyl synthetase family protein [candidate division KSB1 bacterium]MBL7092608.1 polyprenyl synthetase family protein [candidate division KSB1 bacterium]